MSLVDPYFEGRILACIQRGVHTCPLEPRCPLEPTEIGRSSEAAGCITERLLTGTPGARCGMPDSHEIERLGVNAVERAFLDMGWIFREQRISDFGIDAHAEPKQGGRPTGQLIAMQIKTGKSYFRKRGEDFVFYGERKHREYWRSHALPVFIVLHNPEINLTIWQRVDDRLIEEHDSGRWSIIVPGHQLLNSNFEPYIRRGIPSDLASARRFRLTVDLPIIRDLAEKMQTDSIYMKVQEWPNKTLNFRRSEIYEIAPEGSPVYEFDRWLPESEINEFMNYYFPWLDYDYVEEINDISSEINIHTLEVRVNYIGEAFILIEDFYANGRAPLQVSAPYPRWGHDVIDEGEVGGDLFPGPISIRANTNN